MSQIVEGDSAGSVDLMALLRQHAQRAAAQDLTPVAYFYWDGCPACRDLRACIPHPLMQQALANVYLLKLDHVAWEERAAQTDFAYEAVPVFFRLSAEGQHAGMVDGSAWGANTAHNIAPVLKDFFQGKTTGRGPLTSKERKAAGLMPGPKGCLGLWLLWL